MSYISSSNVKVTMDIIFLYLVLFYWLSCLFYFLFLIYWVLHICDQVTLNDIIYVLALWKQCFSVLLFHVLYWRKYEVM